MSDHNEFNLPPDVLAVVDEVAKVMDFIQDRNVPREVRRARYDEVMQRVLKDPTSPFARQFFNVSFVFDHLNDPTPEH